MVVRMADALGWEITPEMALPLYCAMATDTGWFSLLFHHGRDDAKSSGGLIDLGAKPHLIYEQLYERKLVGPRDVGGSGVGGSNKLDCDGRLAYLIVRQTDFEATNAKPVDTEDLVNETLKIAGTQVAFIAIEQVNKNRESQLPQPQKFETWPKIAETVLAAAATNKRREPSFPGPIKPSGRSDIDRDQNSPQHPQVIALDFPRRVTSHQQSIPTPYSQRLSGRAFAKNVGWAVPTKTPNKAGGHCPPYIFAVWPRIVTSRSFVR